MLRMNLQKQSSNDLDELRKEVDDLKMLVDVLLSARNTSELERVQVFNEFFEKCKSNGMFTQHKIYCTPMYYMYIRYLEKLSITDAQLSRRAFANKLQKRLEALGFYESFPRAISKFADFGEFNVRECFEGISHKDVSKDSDIYFYYKTQSKVMCNPNPTSECAKFASQFESKTSLNKAISQLCERLQISENTFFSMPQCQLTQLLRKEV